MYKKKISEWIINGLNDDSPRAQKEREKELYKSGFEYEKFSE